MTKWNIERTLHDTATHCNSAHCNILQHTATFVTRWNIELIIINRSFKENQHTHTHTHIHTDTHTYTHTHTHTHAHTHTHTRRHQHPRRWQLRVMGISQTGTQNRHCTLLLRCVAVCCSMLQRVAVCFLVYQMCPYSKSLSWRAVWPVAHDHSLQHTTRHCNAPYHTATHAVERVTISRAKILQRDGVGLLMCRDVSIIHSVQHL